MSNPLVVSSLPLTWSPTAAAGVVVNVGSSWVDTPAFVQLIASASGAIQLAGFQIEGSNLQGGDYQIDIATGGVGVEVVVATFPFSEVDGGSTITPGGMGYIQFPIAMDIIPNGTRVSTRIRSGNGTGAKTTGCSVGYYSALPATVASTSGTYDTLPSYANGTSITPNAGIWANTAYTQITAATAAELQIIGAAIFFTSQGFQVPSEFEFDLATGSGGSEIVFATLRGATCKFGNPGRTFYPLPAAYDIAAGTRLAVRLRKDNTGTTAVRIKLAFVTGTPSGGGGNGAGKTNNKGKGGGSGVTQVPTGGANVLFYGNPGIDFSTGS